MTATVTEDGILTISVPVTMAPGAHSVIIEIDQDAVGTDDNENDNWLTFVHETAGTWQGDFERPPQDAFEDRAAF